jgi:integrase/recombinase XerD
LKKGYYPNGKNRLNKKVKLRKSLASEHNISLILKFINERDVMSRWKSKNTKRNYIFNLHSLAEFLKDKKFQDVGKEDIVEYVGLLMNKINKKTNRGLKKITIDVTKARIMTFFRWLYDGERPNFLKDMRVNLQPISVTPDQILSEEEIKRLIQIVDNIRDKAVIAVLYESGCRVGEFLNMRIKDIRFDEFGAIANLNGKTGQRSIRLVNSVPYLKEWFRYHPNSKEDSWLWVSKYDHDVERLDYMFIWHILKDTAKKAGITKNVRPHIIRHSRITHTASKLPESALRMMYGWTAGSEMPKIYIHLSGKDVDEIVLRRLYGKNTGSMAEKESLIAPKTCFNCGEVNPSDYDFCFKCKYPLDIETVKAREKKFLMSLTPEVIQKMIESRVEKALMKRDGRL